MLRAADVSVFISDTVRRDLLGRDCQSGELLFNGVDGTIFHPGEGRTELPASVRHIFFVGRYVEKKGLAVVRALAVLRPDLSFLLAGTGPIHPGEWGLPNVHDLGPQSQEAIADLYRSVDLLILPSVGEGYPLSSKRRWRAVCQWFAGRQATAPIRMPRNGCTAWRSISLSQRHRHSAARTQSTASIFPTPAELKWRGTRGADTIGGRWPKG